MSHRLPIVLRRAGLGVVAVLLIAASVAIIGTETGTHWALGQAIRFVPGELLVNEYRGTLLRGLRLDRVSYSFAAIRVTAVDLYLKPDWLRSHRSRIALHTLSAQQIDYENTGNRDAGPKPLAIAMPALPIDITAAGITTRTLRIGDRLINDFAAQGVHLRGNRVRADRVSGELAGVAATVSRLDTTLAGEVPMRADFVWRLLEGPWSGTGNVAGSLAELEFEHDLAGTHPAKTQGKVLLLHRIDPQVDAIVRFESWQFGPINASAGVLQVTGTAKSYRVVLEANISDEQARSVMLTGEVSGNTEGLASIDVLASGAAGRASASGTLAWLPSFSTDLAIEARGIDPSQIAGIEAGALDGELRLAARSIGDFVLEVDSLRGTYNRQPLDAKGRLTRSEDDWGCTSCDVSLGGNRILVDGELGPDGLDATVNVDAPELSLLWPPLSGALTADAKLGGSPALPVFSGTASGSGLRWEDWSLSAFTLSSRSSTLEKVDMKIEVDGLKRGDTAFGGGSGRFSGARSAIDSVLHWKLGEAEARAAAVIELPGEGLNADISSASLSEPHAGSWRLAGPVSLSINAGEFSTSAQTWQNADSRVDVPTLRMTGGSLDIAATLTALPLESLNAVLPGNIRLGGQLDARLELTQVDGQRIGSLSWAQSDTVIRITPPQEEAIDIRVPVASADFRLTGDGAEGRAEVEIEPGLRASLDLATDSLSSDSAIRARFQFSGSEWGWIPAFFPEIDNVQGDISADISAMGSVNAPELKGEMRWQNGQLAIPALNVPLTLIEVTVTGSSAGDARIEGSATAGNGKLTVDGSIADILRTDRSFTVDLGGRKATLLNWPDYQLIASPDLVVRGNREGIRVNGKVAVDQASITVRELPEGAVSPSADVTVAGRTVAPKESIPFSGEVELQLGDSVHVRAFGLDTNLEGDLRFTVAENRAPRAAGKLELVDGVFSAYGQELTIEEGTLTFTGPLDDPIVNVRAVRQVEGQDGSVTAGLELRGRAQNVTSSVFSRPAMSEADALSYLLIGRPLEEATAADGSMLSGTAYGLGLRQATLITNQVGQNLGLDQLSVAGSNQSTTSLVAGKQINPRLYMRYAYGVFTEIGNLLLRYQLSERLTIEAGTGESQSMDLVYSVEKP